MQVSITCRHGNLEPSVQEYISRKAEKLLTYFERVTQIGVTVELEKDRCTVEILVDAEHRQNLVAKDVGAEVIPTFDQALHKIELQVKRYKERLQDHRRDRRLNEIAGGAAEAEADTDEIDETESDVE